MINCALRNGSGTKHGRIGGIKGNRLIHQFGEAGFLLAVNNEAILRFALLPRHTPTFGRSAGQHRAGRRRRRTCGTFVRGQARAVGGDDKGFAFPKSAGKQALLPLSETGQERHPEAPPGRRKRDIGIGTADRSRLNRDLPPVCTQFHSDDLRDQRGNSLPHFQVRHGHGHHPVAPDLEPGVEALLTLLRRQRRIEAARRKRPNDHQAARRSRADQQPPPR